MLPKDAGHRPESAVPHQPEPSFRARMVAYLSLCPQHQDRLERSGGGDGKEYVLKETGVRARKFPDPFLLGSHPHVGGLQHLPDSGNQILGGCCFPAL